LEGIKQDNIDLDKIKIILVSHAHADHIAGIGKVKEERFNNCKVAAHKNDADFVENGDPVRTCSAIPNFKTEFYTCKIDIRLEENDILQVGNVKFKVWSLPGHTPGSLGVEFAINGTKYLMYGDVVYQDGGLGLIDAHWESNIKDYINSAEKIKSIKPDFILPGHGIWFKYSDTIIDQALKALHFYLGRPEIADQWIYHTPPGEDKDVKILRD
ncbi:MAG: MBL fold metallo-hydrolase, partial [Planctomycetes bacterium]|nr:MBL fold metallo-hydrolase [Planctomycetota bacterium]